MKIRVKYSDSDMVSHRVSEVEIETLEDIKKFAKEQEEPGIIIWYNYRDDEIMIEVYNGLREQ